MGLSYYLFIYFFGCTGFSLLPAGFSLVVASQDCSLIVVRGLLIASVVVEHGLLTHGLPQLPLLGSRAQARYRCGAQALLLRGMWNLPGPDI